MHIPKNCSARFQKAGWVERSVRLAVILTGMLFNVCFAQAQSAATNHEAANSDAHSVSIFGSRGVRAHDPSTIVKCGNEYWVFYTGRGVPSYHSKDLIHWEPGPHVFDSAPGWTEKAVPENRNTHYWAPDVIKSGDL